MVKLAGIMALAATASAFSIDRTLLEVTEMVTDREVLGFASHGGPHHHGHGGQLGGGTHGGPTPAYCAVCKDKRDATCFTAVKAYLKTNPVRACKPRHGPHGHQFGRPPQEPANDAIAQAGKGPGGKGHGRPSIGCQNKLRAICEFGPHGGPPTGSSKCQDEIKSFPYEPMQSQLSPQCYASLQKWSKDPATIKGQCAIADQASKSPRVAAYMAKMMRGSSGNNVILKPYTVLPRAVKTFKNACSMVQGETCWLTAYFDHSGGMIPAALKGIEMPLCTASDCFNTDDGDALVLAASVRLAESGAPVASGLVKCTGYEKTFTVNGTMTSNIPGPQ